MLLTQSLRISRGKTVIDYASGKKPATPKHTDDASCAVPKMDSNSVLSAIDHLSRAHQRREIALNRHSTVRAETEDADEDRDCPIFDSFYDADGNEGVMKMVNFSAPEFRALYASIHDRIVTLWNVGRGRKSPHTPMDVLFMALTVLKHGGSWDVLSSVFRMKAPTFERLISGFMKVAAPELVAIFVEPTAAKYTMECLKEKRCTFRHFPFAAEAIDVTFQQANRPSGNMQEGKKYFSGKHKLYGYKVEVAVRPNGLASAFSAHYAGSVSDISIMTRRVQEHKFRLEKVAEDQDITDDEDDDGPVPTHWAIIADKGYQGAHEMLRCITPYKKPANGVLSAAQERFNKDLSSDRIIVENYFGRLQSLWGIMSIKYRWNEGFYDTITALCVALTNAHVEKLPLRTTDGDWHSRYINSLCLIGDERKRKRAESQALYRAHRLRRLRVGFRFTGGADGETQSED